MTEDSGGQILPGSVHASLGYARTRAGASAGTKSIPIYVVWQNASVEGTAWWMTRFVIEEPCLAGWLRVGPRC